MSAPQVRCEMGWKTAAIFVNHGTPGYFAQNPPHKPELARQLIHELDLDGFASAEEFPFGGTPVQTTPDFKSYHGAALYPPDNKFEIGAYDGGIIIADKKLYGVVETADSNPIVNQLIHKYGQSTIMMLELHSVVGYVAYAMYEHQHLVRKFSGADGEISLDVGDPLPEEQSLFKTSRVREDADGKRTRLFQVTHDDGETEEYDQLEIAETLAFAACSRFFGCPLDMFSGDQLRLERFTRKPWWKIW